MLPAATLDQAWGVFSRAACAARLEDARRRDASRKWSESNPDDELARRLWTLGCRSSTTIVDLLRLLHQHRGTAPHVEHIHRVLDPYTDEWAAYRRLLRQHPEVHKRYFRAKEPDPLRPGPFTDTVFANVRLNNLTSSVMWHKAGGDIVQRPRMLCKLASALCGTEAAAADAKATKSTFAEEQATKKRAERQAEVDRVHAALDEAAGGSLAGVEAQNAAVVAAVEAARDAMRATFDREVARWRDRVRAMHDLEAQAADVERQLTAASARILSLAAKPVAATAASAVASAAVERGVQNLVSLEMGVSAHDATWWKTELNRRFVDAAAVVTPDTDIRAYKRALYLYQCRDDLLRTQLPAVVQLARASAMAAPVGAAEIKRVARDDMRELGAPAPPTLPVSIQRWREALQERDTLGICIHLLAVVPNGTPRDACVLSMERGLTALMAAGAPVLPAHSDAHRHEVALLAAMGLQDATVVAGVSVGALLAEYTKQIRDVLVVRLAEAVHTVARPTITPPPTPAPAAAWIVDTGRRVEWWRVAAAATTGGGATTANEVLLAEIVAKAATATTFGELCRSWLALWSLERLATL
jgi:hypothetical protein